MADPILNQPCSFWVQDVEGDDGLPVTGLSQGDWVTSGCLKPDGVTVWTPTITNPGGGSDYLFTFTPNVVGTWKLRAIPDGNTESPVTDSITVTDPAPDAETVAAAVWDASVGDGETGSTKAALARTLNIGSGAITVTNPVAQNNALTLQQGEAYVGEDALSWADNAWSIPADVVAVTMTATYAGVPVTFDGVRVSSTVVSVELTAEQTGDLVPGRSHYRYKVAADGDVLVSGAMTVQSA